MNTHLFKSFFLGGFECSTHRLRTGRRLDLVASTRHDEFAARDYRLLQQHGIRSARDGFRWHLIERTPGRYDWSSVTPMLHAARDTGMQVIWDLWHYGWPDDLDLFSADFVRRFTGYARAAADQISKFDPAPCICPLNEISFISWAAADAGFFFPFAKERGPELKRHLVRTTIEAIHAMRAVNPAIRFFQIEPLINVIPREDRPEDAPLAESYRQSQFEVWDMLSGRAAPELGGSEELLDVAGCNYYIHNQWVHLGGPGSTVLPSNPRYRHVSAMLREVHERYHRPLFIAETGIENAARPAWLAYMCGEVFAALRTGVPVEGLCLYPIVNHPGWDDDRHCANGLFDYADESGERATFESLAIELARQQRILDAMRAGDALARTETAAAVHALDVAARQMEELTDSTRTSTANE